VSPLAHLNTFRCSFQYKLFLIFTLLTGLVFILFSTLYVVSEVSAARRVAAEQLRLQAAGLGDEIRLALYAGNHEALNQFARDAARNPLIRRVVISDAGGRQLAGIASEKSGDRSEPISETVPVAASTMGLSVDDALNGDRVKEPSAIGSVRLERTSADLVASARQMTLTICLLGFGFWLLVSLLCHLVLRRVTVSFNALMRGLERVRQGQYDTRIAVRSDDEPGRAGHAVNELAASLWLREEENRRLNQELKDAMEEERAARNQLAAINRTLEREVADRIQAEQALRESESNLRALMDMMPVGVSWSLADGRVEYVNEFIVKTSGFGRDEFPRAEDWFCQVFPDPEYRARIAEMRLDALACAAGGEEIPSYEARVTCRDGSVRHVLFRHQICMGRNVAIMVDITERELFQEQMIKSQKLESLGVLAGGIAHNFNNVLTGVMGYISFARMFLDPSHKSHAALGHAEEASRRAAGMANQLLTFARGGEPIKRPVSLKRLVDDCLSLALNGTTVRRVVDIPDDLHAVMADEGQITQVFHNIILNAAQAMGEGGVLRVQAENISLARGRRPGAPQEPYVRISFTDQGEGIPATILPKIFDPYFTTKSTGTGLGLASAHSIVSRHGGMIAVDSEPGRGTCFSISLPSTGDSLLPGGNITRRLNPGGQGGGRILVMDDEEGIREFARESLLFLGYRVSCCADGRDALRLYRAASEADDPFFAAILDLNVAGGMGGEEAARRILDFDPSARLIVSSGYAYDPIMAAYRQHGFCAAVSKPYKVDQLEQELNFLKREPPESESCVECVPLT
jgi:PAS domain S-box-containing protein